MEQQKNIYKSQISYWPRFFLAKLSFKSKTYEKPFSYWLKKNSYYHKTVINFYRFLVLPDSSVLHISCKNGYLLNALKPSIAVGIDMDSDSITQAKGEYPYYTFYHGHVDSILAAKEQFDYIILSYITMEADDIQGLLSQLHQFCHPSTRIIVETYSYWWKPILMCLQKFGLKRPTEFKNWMTPYDMKNFLYLAGFDQVNTYSYMFLPVYVPLVSTFINTFLRHVPIIRSFSLISCIVARSNPFYDKKNSMHQNMNEDQKNVVVSVVIPCRNEKGNIESAVQRCPQMGNKTELIFVEGNSNDGTLEEIKRVAQAYPQKNISWYVQDGKGKGDAVRKGFSYSSGDILMILDADLTMPPEELPKFFDAMVSRNGEFINGSRLVYGMESKAMRFLNTLANFFFSVFLSWGLGHRIKDSLCGTKVLWRKDYERIVAQRAFWRTHDPFGDFDLLFGAARLNLKIVDMPIHYKSRTYGKPNIRRFWHGFMLLWMSFVAIRKIKFR